MSRKHSGLIPHQPREIRIAVSKIIPASILTLPSGANGQASNRCVKEQPAIDSNFQHTNVLLRHAFKRDIHIAC